MTRPIEPGIIVKVNTGQLAVARGAPAIFLSTSRSGGVRLLTDAGIASVVRWQIVVPRFLIPTFPPMRLRLAYGVWTEKDGSRVLYSRDYMPLWRISPDGCVAPEEPWRWITFVDQAWFWDDAHPP